MSSSWSPSSRRMRIGMVPEAHARTADALSEEVEASAIAGPRLVFRSRCPKAGSHLRQKVNVSERRVGRLDEATRRAKASSTASSDEQARCVSAWRSAHERQLCPILVRPCGALYYGKQRPLKSSSHPIASRVVPPQINSCRKSICAAARSPARFAAQAAL